jgi:hypothetical protein
MILKGALYQPNRPFLMESFWVIPATEKKGTHTLDETQLILVSDGFVKTPSSEIRLFIFCYQFLFKLSLVYRHLSLSSQLDASSEEHVNVATLIKKYESGGAVEIDFDSIDYFHTELIEGIHFRDFYATFVDKYREEECKNVVDLYLYTIGFRHSIYDNILMKIAQLRSIFETIIGEPSKKTVPCEDGQCHYNDTWADHITKQLTHLGMKDVGEANFMVGMNKILNQPARIAFVHYAKQINTREKTMSELRAENRAHQTSLHATEYTTDFGKIIDETFESKDWTGFDWENVFFVYGAIVKKIIYLKYFVNSKID